MSGSPVGVRLTMARISASTAASFLSSATRSASWSAARRRRSRPISSRGRILASNALAFTAVSAWGAPPEIRPTRSRCRRFTHCVRRSTSSLRRFASSRRDALRSSLRTSGRSRVCRPRMDRCPSDTDLWGVAREGSAPLEVALPSLRPGSSEQGEEAVAKVVIGVDPHKRLNAVVVIDVKGKVLARRQFPNSAEGFGELRSFGRQWRPRTWAVEGCNGVGKHLAQRLVAVGERVVDVSTRRAALVRVFAGGNGRKNDDVDAHSVALVGLHTRDLPEVRKDDRSASLRLLANRRKELVDLRTQCVNRLHRDLVGLISGGAPQALTAVKAKALLASIRPRDEMGRLRRRLAADQLADLVALDKKLAAVEAEIRNRRSPGRAYYERKLAEAKTNKEALRCLKRRISDVVYRQLLADAERQAKAGPGGQTGTTLQSSVTGPTPTAGSSDKPQPGPATEATPTPFGPRVDRGGANLWRGQGPGRPSSTGCTPASFSSSMGTLRRGPAFRCPGRAMAWGSPICVMSRSSTSSG